MKRNASCAHWGRQAELVVIFADNALLERLRTRGDRVNAPTVLLEQQILAKGQRAVTPAKCALLDHALEPDSQVALNVFRENTSRIEALRRAEIVRGELSTRFVAQP